MVASVASLGSLDLIQGLMARAVSPAAAVAALQDRPRPPAAQPSASTVALAPAAMTALIEAQERLSHHAPPLVRQRTARKIDQLIARLDDGANRANASADAPLAVRRLQRARDALSAGRVDLQA